MTETENNTKSLLEELKNLNKTLREDLDKEKAVGANNAHEDSDDVALSSTQVSATPILASANLSTVPIVPTVSSVSIVSTQVPVVSSTINDSNLSDYIYQKSEAILNEALDTIQKSKPAVVYSGDGKVMSGYASMVAAAAAVMDTLNAISIERKKHENTKEIKQIDFENKKKLQDLKPKKLNGPKNVNLIATREDLMKLLSDNQYPVNEKNS